MDREVIINSGIIVKAVSGFYYVLKDGEVFECSARGNFRHSKISPIVGDNVEFTVGPSGKGTVEKIMPRKNVLLRPAVANIDKLIIVSAFESPAPDTNMIDRLTAIAVYKKIKPIIVFNKSDTGDLSRFESIYKNAGFNTYTVSANIPDSMNSLKKEFKDCICAMTGNTGVGKSSILNAIFKDLNLKTGEISLSLGRGKHTTRHTQLIFHSLNGFVADTPGFSSITQTEDKYDFKQNLQYCFEDFKPYINDCKFSSCNHINEKGCGVINAVMSGKIEKTRHDSYVSLFNELKSVNKWD